MIKFFDKDTALFETNEQFVSFDIIKSPLKEILKKEDYSSFFFSNGEKEEKIGFDQTFILQINIKDSASIICAFQLENLNRGELINKVASLKSIKIVDLESCRHKSEELFKIIKEYNPYFLIYHEKNGFPLRLHELKDLLASLEYSDEISVLFINKDAVFDEPVKEEKKKEVKAPQEEKQIETKLENKKSNEFKNHLVMDLDNIKKNKYHFIFLVVSSFLFGFASSVGYCNALLGKLITILFFICAGVGLFLDTYVYLDFFRERKIKDRLFPYSILFNVFGIVLAIGSTMLFYFLDNTGVKAIVSAGVLVGIGIGMSFGSVLISVCLAYLIVFIGRKKKSNKIEAAPIEKKEVAPSKEKNKEKEN